VTEMDVSLADELLLFGYDDLTGRAEVASADLECGLAGAWMMELALARRIDVLDGKVSVLDDAPLGDAEADTALGRIAGEDKPHPPEWWIDRLRPGLRERMLDRLTDRGMLRLERGRTMLVVPVRRYVSADSAAESAARARLEDVVVRGAEPDARTAALASLLDACGLARRSLPDDIDPGELEARMKQLRDGQWTSDAVRAAIQSIQAALIVATTVATTTAGVATTA
jgi:hypothetical protein